MIWLGGSAMADWSSIKIKKGPGFCGDVTQVQKNETISEAVAQWQSIGLSGEQQTMGVESGLNSDAIGNSTLARGLGQFNDPTWESTVKYYNNNYSDNLDFKNDEARKDSDTQITFRVPARAGA